MTSIDKTKWPIVKFGDVVKLNTARCADPMAEGIERYVGLEHIEPEDLHIRRWGLVAEGTTFTNRFKPGQVLFGKRRAYQRKIAVADFEGVCSGDIYVFEPKNDRMLPELLPFLCQTESFFEHAVGTSAGSLSPRTNWAQLAEYEFALPSLDEQQRITSILSSIEQTMVNLQYVVSTALVSENSFLKDVFGLYIDSKCKWPKVELRHLAYIQSGVAKGRQEEPGRTIDVPYIGVANVQDGFLDLSEIKMITVERTKIDQCLLQVGDVLMTEGGDPDKLGRGTVWQGEIEGCIHQNHIFAVRPDSNQLKSWFLATITRSIYAKQYFLSCSKRTSNLATVNKQQVGSLLVPLPSLSIQENIVSNWMAIRNASRQARGRLQKIQFLRAKILNSVLGCTL